jgi:hypothetical protein
MDNGPPHNIAPQSNRPNLALTRFLERPCSTEIYRKRFINGGHAVVCVFAN